MQALNEEKDNIPRNIKVEQLNSFVKKVWGHEEWIVNNPKYCGKKLVLKKCFRCSMHKHDVKDETFYVLSGKVLMETDYLGEAENRIMTVGDVIHIKTGMWHRFSGITDAQIMEFSTFHMDEDSIIKEPSGSFDLGEFGF